MCKGQRHLFSVSEMFRAADVSVELFPRGSFRRLTVARVSGVSAEDHSRGGRTARSGNKLVVPHNWGECGGKPLLGTFFDSNGLVRLLNVWSFVCL